MPCRLVLVPRDMATAYGYGSQQPSSPPPVSSSHAATDAPFREKGQEEADPLPLQLLRSF